MSELQKSLDKLYKMYNTKDRKVLGHIDEVARLEGSFTTGSIQLDALLKGGYKRGGINTIFGREGAGKTTSTLHAIADCQSQGLNAAFIDVEGSIDKDYATSLGVDLNVLHYAMPDSGEQAFTIAEILIRSGEIHLVVIDSIAALLPEKEDEGDYGDSQMGSQARLMSQAFRKLTPLVRKTGAGIIFTNQMRENIGGYGNPWVTPGGNAERFYSDIRLEISRFGPPILDTDNLPIGGKRKVKIVKSKVSSYTDSVITFDMLYGIGIDSIGEVLDMCIANGVIEKKGSWFQYDTVKEQGREAMKQFLKDNPGLVDELKRGLGVETPSP